MRVCVVGAGRMGARVALRGAQRGCETIVVARSVERARASLEAAADEIDERSALEGITIRDDLSAIASAQFVYEAIPEILSEKQRLFSELEAFIDDHVPIVSGTSTFFPDKLGFYLEFPKRVFVAHFVHPVTLCPLAEIVEPSADVDRFAAATLDAWIEKLALEPIRLSKPLPGFIINRLQFAMLREALHIVEKGGATAEEVDTIVRLGLGPRWTATGPIESIALGGPATFADVAHSVVPTLDNRERIPLIEEPGESLPSPDAARRRRASDARKRAYLFARELR